MCKNDLEVLGRLRMSSLRPCGADHDRGQTCWSVLYGLPPHELIPGLSFPAGNGDSALERS